MSTPAILILLTLGLPWLGALVVWAAGDRTEKLSHTLAVIFAVLSAVAGLGLLLQTGSEPVKLADLGGVFGPISFVPDGLGVFLSVVATFIGSLAVIFSVNYMHGEKQLSRYYAYMLFFIGAMVGLVLTSNMLLMFVFWEITALCSYALISFNSDDPKAVAGGVKALIMTQIGGIGLLLGALVVLVLAVLVLMTPSLQLRQTTLQAMQQTAALTQQAAPAAAQRQALMAQAQDLHHLAPQLHHAVGREPEELHHAFRVAQHPGEQLFAPDRHAGLARREQRLA